LVFEDDASVPGNSITDIQTLISDHVVAIADMSDFDETWASTIQAAHIPIVGVFPDNVPMYTNPDFYPIGQTNDSITYALAATAKAAGATNLGVMYCAEAVVCQQDVAPIKAAGQPLGVPVAYNAEVSATAPNYTAQCVAAQQQHVSAVIILDASSVDSRIGADCARQGYFPIYLIEGIGFSDIQLSAPGIKNNLWGEYPNLPFWANTPAVSTMNAAIDKYYPALRGNTTLYTTLVSDSWVSGLVLAQAIQAGGLGPNDTPSAAEVTTGLETLKGYTVDGLAPPLTYAAGKDHPVDCWFIGRVQNGATMLENNGQITCEHGSSS
jgi:branched-chain amino acid transport system substrate-binding protein